MVVGHWVEGNAARWVGRQHLKVPVESCVDCVDAVQLMLLQEVKSWDPQKSEGVVLATLSCEIRKSEVAVLRLNCQAVQPVP